MEKVIKDFPKYTVNEKGIITDTRTGETVNHIMQRGGIHVVALRNDGIKKNVYMRVSRLVAAAFVERATPMQTMVIYKDGNKDNLNAQNLEWVTRRKTYEHAKLIKSRHGKQEQRGTA